ncbi:unnamed protein product [Prorocentrum cordatum]|uniref:Uncharacterized protein n=1 Tax=Prorocentrum cordatum TaxID=2364126 RepID=A0ABN9V7F5_9DINO|nr:unnamed protein product [Polarella glacialis]
MRLPAALAVRAGAGCPRLAQLCEAGECSRALALALTVLHGSHVASPRSPYFDDLVMALLLPVPAPDTPLLWPREDLLRLAGTSLLPRAHGDAAALAAALEASAEEQRASFQNDVLPVVSAASPGGCSATRTLDATVVAPP